MKEQLEKLRVILLEEIVEQSLESDSRIKEALGEVDYELLLTDISDSIYNNIDLVIFNIKL